MISRMDSQWFKSRLKALKKSQLRLAEELGLAPARITEIFKGQRKVSIEEASKMASFLDVPVNMVFRRLGLVETGAMPVPIISWVSAGTLVQPDIVLDGDDSPLIEVAGLDAAGDWIALRVESDSMDRISPPESIILANRRDKRLVANACYVIADVDGKATYKRYRPNPKRFEPVSTNPAHEPIFPDNDPLIVGRVRMTILRM